MPSPVRVKTCWPGYVAIGDGAHLRHGPRRRRARLTLFGLLADVIPMAVGTHGWSNLQIVSRVHRLRQWAPMRSITRRVNLATARGAESGVSSQGCGNPWRVLGLVAVGTFMTTLDSSIVSISLPALARHCRGGWCECWSCAWGRHNRALDLAMDLLAERANRNRGGTSIRALVTLGRATAGALRSDRSGTARHRLERRDPGPVVRAGVGLDVGTHI